VRALQSNGSIISASMSSSAAPADSTANAVAKFEQVSMRYGEGPEVLSDVNLTLPRGSFHFLTGPSGAGKTSLLRLIYLAQPPARGRISLFGRPAEHLRRNEKALLRRRIGVVFQEFRLLDHLSVFDNVALPLRVTGQRRADYADDVAELLDWVGLGAKLAASPATLSGGEQQRVAIARAVVNKPDLLIADEPTGNVDPERADRLMRLFGELNRLGTTVVIATHDLHLVRKANAPVLSLAEGRLSQESRR